MFVVFNEKLTLLRYKNSIEGTKNITKRQTSPLLARLLDHEDLLLNLNSLDLCCQCILCTNTEEVKSKIDVDKNG